MTEARKHEARGIRRIYRLLRMKLLHKSARERAKHAVKERAVALADKYQLPEKAETVAKQARETALTVKGKTHGVVQKFMQDYVEGTRLDPAVRRVDALAQFMLFGTGKISDNEAVAVAGRPIRVGLWLAFFLFVVFGGWAACAPLSSAAVAGGSLVLDSYTKVIQHLEGGIVEEILARDGDAVAAGQALIRLDDTAAGARVDLLTGQLRATKAAEARLLAERDGADVVAFDSALTDAHRDPEVAKIMDAQRRLFESRRDALAGEISVLEQRIKQFGDEITGLEAQRTSVAEQLALINEEVGTVKTLVEKGQAVKPRLLALQRRAAELEGSRGEYAAQIARAKQSIAEAEIQIINVKTKRQGEVMAELRETQVTIADIGERLHAARDVLTRTVISAPEAGVVTDLKFHTIGGVIPPGAEVMKLVPQDERLIVEAAVLPQDIDVVHAGLPARIRLSAYSSRLVPMVDGTVLSVSADRLVEKSSGRAYYLARVEVDGEELKELAGRVDLYPGMPADVLIVTGERTLLSYLLDPITATFDKAFREE